MNNNIKNDDNKYKKYPLINYTLRIIRDAKFWQTHSLLYNLAPKEEKKTYFKYFKFIFKIVSILLVLFVANGVGKDFAGYIIAALSIFIGLNINLIIMMFDKFLGTDFSIENTNRDQRILLLKKKNFFRQFISLTSFSILLSILLILLLSICFHSNESIDLIDKIRITYNSFTNDYSLSFSWNVFFLALKQTCIVVIRYFIYYFLFYYLLILLYTIGSIYSYISKVIKDKIIIIDKRKP